MNPTEDRIADATERGRPPLPPATGTPIAIEPIMARLRQRAREGLGWSGDRNREPYEHVKRVFQASHEALSPGAPFHAQVLGPEEDWEVPTPLVWESHRGRLGRIIVWVKRSIFFPLNRWLYGYTWHNLHRQQRLNRVLLSAVESLAVSHARLQQDVDALRLRLAGSANAPEDAVEARPGPERTGAVRAPRPARLAFVVDRYGADVPGGAERHCRDFAERLAGRGHAVTVLTSCARDYVTWANAFEPGTEQDGPVTVLRFPVAAERDQEAWRVQSRRVFSGLGSDEEERAWFQQSGPYVPALIRHLEENKDGFDLFIFVSYRYYPTFAGLPVVAPRAILLPTAEEDPAIRLGVLRQFFTLPLGIIHNSPEEHELIRSVTRGEFPAFSVIGSGVDEASAGFFEGALERLGVRRPYVLCLGRVDPNKGSLALLTHFRRFVEMEGSGIQLVLAGQPVVEIEPHPEVRVLGHVDEADRQALLHHMLALAAPSPFESLSLSLLEGWMHGRPALVNGWCKVLRGQVTRANGGLYYDNAAEFREALRYLRDEPEAASRLGSQGRDHARREYGWPVVMDRLEDFLQDRLSVALGRSGRAPGPE